LEIRKIAFPLPLVVFFILAIFYTFYSIDYAVSRDFFFQLVSYGVIFFLIAQIPSAKEAQRIGIVIAILGFLTSLYSLYQYFWGFHDLIGKIGETELFYPSPLKEEIIGRLEGGRVFSTFCCPAILPPF